MPGGCIPGNIEFFVCRITHNEQVYHFYHLLGIFLTRKEMSNLVGRKLKRGCAYGPAFAFLEPLDGFGVIQFGIRPAGFHFD